MKIGDKVRLTEKAITSEWTRNQVGGKVGTIIDYEPSESMFDVAVKFEGTSRIGGTFAFNSVDLEKVATTENMRLLPVTRDSGSALSVYRHAVDVIRDDVRKMPAEDLLFYLAELSRRAPNHNAYAMLAKRMVAEWVSRHPDEALVVPVVEVTVTTDPN